MNTSKLKTFAQQSRRILMQGVKQKLRYWGFNEKGEAIDEPMQVGGGVILRGEPIDDPTVLPKWEALRKSIRRHGLEATVEEAAYTWFNRFMAIRILSKNGYDPAQLEYEGNGSRIPVILAKARRGITGYLTAGEKERLQLFLTNYSQEHTAFAILITGYCHSHKLLNWVFGRLNDFTELLLPDNILADKGFIHLLNTTDAIAEDDYKAVELIGWLYQFYISEKKDEVFKGFKKNKKAEAEDIPAATQIFTPNWIVKYMVQNTAGRIWLDHHPDSPLRQKMKYLVEPPADETSEKETNSNSINPPTEGESSFSKGGVERQRDGGFNQAAEPPVNETSERPLSPLGGNTKGASLLPNGDPIHLRLLDPATGSGHILVEGFALLYEMYMEEYYLPAEAVENILTKNLFGLELDLRAAQLARFAVLLAAAKKTPEILKKDILPRIYAMPEPAEFTQQEVRDFLGSDGVQHEKVLTNALQLMQQAQNLGSVMQFNVTENERQFFKQRWETLQTEAKTNLTAQTLAQKLEPFLNIIFALTRKYEAIAANPPYMGQKNMNNDLKKYVNDNYPLTKSDLFAVFMDVSLNCLVKAGKMGMINQHSWMFLSSFEKLRSELLKKHGIENMLHLGPRTFEELSGEVVQSTAFVLAKGNPDREGTYVRLVDYKNVKEKERVFLRKENFYPNIPQSNFSKIPGSPIAYWVSDDAFRNFKRGEILKIKGDTRQGMATSDNKRFLRFWAEVAFINIGFDSRNRIDSLNSGKKWFPYNKGGQFRKWYGNQDFIVDWANDGENVLNYASSLYGSATRTIKSISEYFKESISWSKVTAGSFAMRYFPPGFIFDVAGCCVFYKKDEEMFFHLGLLNSQIGKFYLKILSPTLNFEAGSIANFPVVESYHLEVVKIVKCNIEISQKDWNSFETSWDFQSHPLLKNDKNSFEESYNHWQQEATKQFNQLHANEEELNRIFIDIYGLNNELDPVVPLKNITILQEELDRTALEKTDKELRKHRQWKLEEGKWQLYVNGELVPPPAEGELPPATVQPQLPIKKDVIARQLISYAIGCMMGRYSLDKPGLILANQGETLEDYYKIITEGESSFSKGGVKRQRDGGLNNFSQPDTLATEGESPLEKGGGIRQDDGGFNQAAESPTQDYSNNRFPGRTSLEMTDHSTSGTNQQGASFIPPSGGQRGASFVPDDDAIIPLMGSNCGFSDDALHRLRHFIEVVWGSETLTQNINFLQECLGMDLEKYLTSQNNFWKDHCSRYKKKPIYWLFSSPTGAFQALVYMHRMNKYTVQKIRDNYLLKHLQWLNGQISQLQSRSSTLVREEQKYLDGLQKALKECEEYDKYLKDIADKLSSGLIEIDLDDGVSINYPKFESVVAKIK